jgi:hypothetical protein
LRKSQPVISPAITNICALPPPAGAGSLDGLYREDYMVSRTSYREKIRRFLEQYIEGA